MLAIATGVFAMLAVQSRREAGLGGTANARPVPIREMPAERLELLARIEPPEYRGPAPEDAQSSREFRAALERYVNRDYAGAVPSLRAVGAQGLPESIEARFYLAICLLVTNDRPNGILELYAVISAGETSYLEAARFYLAKALLGSGNIVGAEQQLRKAIEMHGKLEKEAEALHAQIVPGH